jgi:hypothetical protein
MLTPALNFRNASQLVAHGKLQDRGFKLDRKSLRYLDVLVQLRVFENRVLRRIFGPKRG